MVKRLQAFGQKDIVVSSHIDVANFCSLRLDASKVWAPAMVDPRIRSRLKHHQKNGAQAPRKASGGTMRFVRSTAFAVTLGIWGCGAETHAPQMSETNYLSWSTDSIRASLIGQAKKEVVNVCLQGSVTAADLQRAKTWSRRAILTWFRALKVIDERVTGNIALTCTNRDLTINLKTGDSTSFASPSVATIYTQRPFGTWTHEFGHALAGLTDTYGGGAGSCKSGQPLSLMCWGAYGPRANLNAWSTLWPDDIKGIQANYRLLNSGGTTAPAWADEVDLEAPLDLSTPWPDAPTQFVADGPLDVTIIPGGLTPIDESFAPDKDL